MIYTTYTKKSELGWVCKTCKISGAIGYHRSRAMPVLTLVLGALGALSRGAHRRAPVRRRTFGAVPLASAQCTALVAAAAHWHRGGGCGGALAAVKR